MARPSSTRSRRATDLSGRWPGPTAAPRWPTIRDASAALPNLLIMDAVGASTGAFHDDVATRAPTSKCFANFTLADTTVVSPTSPTHFDRAAGWAWLATAAVPLGYLGDAEKTARTFPTIDGVRWSIPRRQGLPARSTARHCSAGTRSPSIPAGEDLRRGSGAGGRQPSGHLRRGGDRPALERWGRRSSRSCSSPRARRPPTRNSKRPARHISPTTRCRRAFVRTDHIVRSPRQGRPPLVKRLPRNPLRATRPDGYRPLPIAAAIAMCLRNHTRWPSRGSDPANGGMPPRRHARAPPAPAVEVPSLAASPGRRRAARPPTGRSPPRPPARRPRFPFRATSPPESGCPDLPPSPASNRSSSAVLMVVIASSRFAVAGLLPAMKISPTGGSVRCGPARRSAPGPA